MASIFTRIIQGEIPCYKVAETQDFIAFLDIQPVSPGHTLLVPKREIDYFFDLDDETLMGMNLFAKAVSNALREVVPCNRIGVSVIGLEVPHAHMHLIPISQLSDMDFSRPRPAWSPEELTQMAARIYAHI
ncbi:MAG: HIT family protein [Sphingobacteriia bacterium]|nr:HIT family protein [Sphingobacteriia bacterium]